MPASMTRRNFCVSSQLALPSRIARACASASSTSFRLTASLPALATSSARSGASLGHVSAASRSQRSYVVSNDASRACSLAPASMMRRRSGVTATPPQPHRGARETPSPAPSPCGRSAPASAPASPWRSRGAQPRGAHLQGAPALRSQPAAPSGARGGSEYVVGPALPSSSVAPAGEREATLLSLGRSVNWQAKYEYDRPLVRADVPCPVTSREGLDFSTNPRDYRHHGPC